ncbi:MAG TPA: DUF2182 domain-containing protein [Gemmatimonadales bacterium]
MRDALAARVNDRRVILGGAAAMTAAAWAYLAVSAHPGGFAFAFIAWTAMTLAMMMPAVTPWIVVLSTDDRSAPGAAPVFLLGYFLVWMVYAATAAGAQVGVAQAGLVPHGSRVGTAVGGAVLLGAGAFQFTPLKAACLRHCRSPLLYFMRAWRDGPVGILSLGLKHGLYCLGCCWALMAVAFAVGVMNLAWMAAITVLVCIENGARHGPRMGRVAGGLLAGWGTWLIVSGLS